jgi:hypothetical protein
MMRNGGVQRIRRIATGFALCIGIGVAQPSMAATIGILSGHALATVSGRVPLMADTDGDGTTAPDLYYGDIDYAVFRAADFLTAFPSATTPNGGLGLGEIVYAYQVYYEGNLPGVPSLSSFSAGLADQGPSLGAAFMFQHGHGLPNDDENVTTGDQSFINNSVGGSLAGTQNPQSTQVPGGSPYPGSVKYNFLSSFALNGGETSTVLFYTSPWGPEWDNGTTSHAQGASRIPSPLEGRLTPFIPEPSSLALASLAMIGWAACGRRRVGN